MGSAKDFMFTYGNTSTDLLNKDIKFIIKTTTKITTRLKILQHYARKIIKNCTKKKWRKKPKKS